LNNANGATLFGDASGTGNQFQMAGSISGAGGVVLGSGISTVNGYINLGSGGGGDVSDCSTVGTTTGVTGLDVTPVVSSASTVSSCGSSSVTSAFCLGSGFDTVKLTAPSSTSTLGSRPPSSR
jgi:hypothetical protein